MRRLTIVASVMVLAASIAPLALGQQGNGKSKGNNPGRDSFGLTLVMQNDVNGNGVPNWGDSVTFNVSTTESWNQVNLTCSQDGVVVYGAVWPNTPTVTLSSTMWHAGAADCTAVVIAFDSKKVLASLSFTAGD
jgi:hypothetical protein